MDDRPPSQIKRLIAVGGVIVMFVLVIAVIATSAGNSGGDSGSSDGGSTTTTTVSHDPDIRKALEKGEYTVKEGDTLTSISEATGIDVETLNQLNPDIDPQVLITGAKIKLR
jgi:LysM domain-containing protein